MNKRDAGCICGLSGNKDPVRYLYRVDGDVVTVRIFSGERYRGEVLITLEAWSMLLAKLALENDEYYVEPIRR
jgi:hypothetical protein